MNGFESMVVLVNSKDRRDLLSNALEAIRRVAPGLTGIVFDAGSTDGSLEWMQDWASSSQGRWLCLDGRQFSDTSFSNGLNQAALEAAARFPDCKYFFLYETDNELKESEPLSKALEFLESHPSHGAVGFSCRKHSGDPSGSGDCFPTWGDLVLGPQWVHHLGGTGRQGRPSGESPAWTEMDVVYTSPLLVRREVWERLKGLDALRFPFSETDVDFAWRMQKLGFRQAILQDDRVIHDNQDQISGWSRTRALRFHQARHRLLTLHRGPIPFAARLLLPARHFAECLLLGLTVLLRKPRARERFRTRLKLLFSCWKGYS